MEGKKGKKARQLDQVKSSKFKKVAGSKALAIKQKNAQFNRGHSTNGPAGFSKSGKDLAADLEAAKLRANDWEGEELICPNDWAEDCECPACKRASGEYLDEINAQAWGLTKEQHEKFMEKFEHLRVDDSDEDSDDGVTDLDLEMIEPDQRKLKQLKVFTFSDGNVTREPDKDFAIHVDRERAKVFKPQWYAADFKPGSQDRYLETHDLMEESKKLNSSARLIKARFVQLLCWLNVHPSEHRLVFRDVADTFAFVGIFFPDQVHALYQNVKSWRHGLKDRTKLVDNEYKETQEPYYRDWRSSQIQNRTFFDEARVAGKRKWDYTVRPLVAQLY